ncbi:type I-C CRISPR-associated protein Cas8c/Csd1 [Parathermosynechococcus lividus]
MTILTVLKNYAEERLDLPPSMYGENTIAWLIELDSAGRFQGITPLKSKDAKRGQKFITPHIGRTSGVKPKLLADTAEYVLGIARAHSKAERVAECHRQFVALVEACALQTQEPSVQAILAFYQSGAEIDRAKAALLAEKDFEAGDGVMFRVAGHIQPADARSRLTSIEQFWQRHSAATGDTDAKAVADSPIMTCLVTGKETQVAKRMPFMIKGLIGGQSSGVAMVSANAKAFTSYGLEGSLTSPISPDAAEKFAKALNHLLADEQSRLHLSETTYVFWTREKTTFNVMTLLTQPRAQEVANLLNSVKTGKQASSFDQCRANEFYALALRANKSRVVVCDWLETTIPHVQEQLTAWFEFQRLVSPEGGQPHFFSVYALAASLYRDREAARKEMSGRVVTALMRLALYGDRLPEELLATLVRRNCAERTITYPRAVLLKLIFLSNTRRKPLMTNMHQLNPDPCLEGTDLAAYTCGRLLALLELVQQRALGSVNTTLVDRYYGAASNTPAVAFPPLLRGARSHLAKLRKEKGGLARRLEEALEEVVSQLMTFPKTLNLQQQGLFSLGYYHQRAEHRRQAQAAKASQDDSEASLPMADPADGAIEG